MYVSGLYSVENSPVTAFKFYWQTFIGEFNSQDESILGNDGRVEGCYLTTTK